MLLYVLLIVLMTSLPAMVPDPHPWRPVLVLKYERDINDPDDCGNRGKIHSVGFSSSITKNKSFKINNLYLHTWMIGRFDRPFHILFLQAL